MAARAGMAQLIQDVRLACNLEAGEDTVGGSAYWSNETIQQNLDRYRSTHKGVSLLPLSDVGSGGTLTYTEYVIPVLTYFEQQADDSGWNLIDSAGGTAPANTPNYEASLIAFDADTAGTAYYLSCRTYDYNRSVADIWDKKAALVADGVDWASDNHRINAGQRIKAYRQMAQQFRSMGGVRYSVMRRTDERA